MTLFLSCLRRVDKTRVKGVGLACNMRGSFAGVNDTWVERKRCDDMVRGDDSRVQPRRFQIGIPGHHCCLESARIQSTGEVRRRRRRRLRLRRNQIVEEKVQAEQAEEGTYAQEAMKAIGTVGSPATATDSPFVNPLWSGSPESMRGPASADAGLVPVVPTPASVDSMTYLRNTHSRPIHWHFRSWTYCEMVVKAKRKFEEQNEDGDGPHCHSHVK